MTFENIIKRISAFCAAVVVYTLALGIYLSAKGFIMDNDGNITLVKSAVAQEVKDVKAQDENGNQINTEITSSTSYFMGKEDAPLTIYEYSSFGCSHCSDFHLFTLPKLKKDFIDTGKVKLVFIDFPLDKKSMQAALISHCIKEENYFEFLNILFKNQMEWALSFKTEKVLSNYASLFGLTAAEADKCMKDEDTQNKILNNRQQGIEMFKIQGTPAFILSHNGKKETIFGASSYEEFKKSIEEMLNIKAEEPKVEEAKIEIVEPKTEIPEAK